MKREEIEKISMERLYMLGGALLRYFNGMEITDEVAYIISNCQDSEIVPAIKMVQLHNSKNKNNHFAESTTKIKFAGYTDKLKKNK